MVAHFWWVISVLFQHAKFEHLFLSQNPENDRCRVSSPRIQKRLLPSPEGPVKDWCLFRAGSRKRLVLPYVLSQTPEKGWRLKSYPRPQKRTGDTYTLLNVVARSAFQDPSVGLVANVLYPYPVLVSHCVVLDLRHEVSVWRMICSWPKGTKYSCAVCSVPDPKHGLINYKDTKP